MNQFHHQIETITKAAGTKGALTAWQDATKSDAKRTAFRNMRLGLNDICEWASLPDGTVDETKIPKVLWEEKGLKGDRIERLVADLQRGQFAVQSSVISGVLEAAERVERLFQ